MYDEEGRVGFEPLYPLTPSLRRRRVDEKMTRRRISIVRMQKQICLDESLLRIPKYTRVITSVGLLRKRLDNV